jgi:hypothetical protein
MRAANRGYVTMFPMKEKPMSTKRAKAAPGEHPEREAREPGRDDAPRNDDRPERPETEARARELAERHRETLDYLSKN